MIESLVSGRVHQAAKQKTDRTGKPFVTFRLKVANGESTMLIGAICYEPSAIEALLSLQVGDAVAVTGSLTVRVWIDAEGRPKPSADMVVRVLLTAYHASSKLRAIAGQGKETPGTEWR